MFYSTAHVYINRKMRIKHAKNRMKLWIKKLCTSKNHTCVQWLGDLSLVSMYEVVLLFFYCWMSHNSIALKYCMATNNKQTCSLQSQFKPTSPKCYYQCNFVIGIYKWFIIFQQNSFFKIAISHFVYRNIHHHGLGICSK